MILTQLSVSQISSFDHAQTGGCNLKFWFERVNDLREDPTDAQGAGTAGHALLETYFKTGVKPPKRSKMSKAVTGAIVKGELPVPGDDLLVERRFSGQAKFDDKGDWVPLEVSKTIHLGGIPLDGFIDLAFRRGDVPEIWDHKFSSDIHLYSLKASQLIQTVQMPVYVLSQLPRWPDATQWRLVHHNVSKTGVDSFVRSATVHVDDVLERKASIEATIELMKSVALLEHQDDVPFNKKACEAFAGCPHQSICKRFKEKQTVSLTPEEATIFGSLGELAAQVEPPKRRMKMVDEAPILPPDAPVSSPVVVAPAAATVTASLPLFDAHPGSGKLIHSAPILPAAPTPPVHVISVTASPAPSVVLPAPSHDCTSSTRPEMVVRFELGPSTLAVLERLLSK